MPPVVNTLARIARVQPITLDPLPPRATHQANTQTAERLRRLDDLRATGAITDVEFYRLRSDVLRAEVLGPQP